MFKFVEKFKYALIAPILILIAGIICLCIMGLNVGLDFSGGTLMTIDMGKEFSDSDIHTAFSEQGIGNIQITQSSKDGQTNTVALVRMAPLSEGMEETDLRIAVMESLQANYPDSDMTDIERVGGVASGDLIRSAVLSIVIACVLMMIYIWFRFQLVTGIAAVLTLLHDVLVMLALMVIFQIPINSTFVAAVLTIVGYSINNTIVIFDRIRENKLRMAGRDVNFDNVVDRGINESMWRTVNTTITTLVTITLVYFLGVEDIKQFALPIIIGLLSGVYSSLFLAGPFWALCERKGILVGHNKVKKKKPALKI